MGRICFISSNLRVPAATGWVSARIPADQAVAIGLANRVVPDDQLLDEAFALADKLAAQPPQAIQSTKRALNMHMKRAVAGVLEYALGEEFRSFDTPEHQQLVRDFLERSRSRAEAARQSS